MTWATLKFCQQVEEKTNLSLFEISPFCMLVMNNRVNKVPLCVCVCVCVCVCLCLFVCLFVLPPIAIVQTSRNT
jgi:hypothetical protein